MKNYKSVFYQQTLKISFLILISMFHSFVPALALCVLRQLNVAW